MTAAYVRVSSKGQDHAMQRLAIERAATARLEGVGLEWFEEKESATTMRRPELERLRAAVRAGNVRRIYVWKLDRLTRTGIRDTLELVEEARAHECELVSTADGFDLSGPVAEVVIAVMAWAAKMELHARRERIAARRALADERGEPWGRPSRLDPATRRDIVRRRKAGESVRQVAIALKVPKSTVARVRP